MSMDETLIDRYGVGIGSLHQGDNQQVFGLKNAPETDSDVTGMEWLKMQVRNFLAPWALRHMRIVVTNNKGNNRN